MVDEFATLATELPGFVDALVEVAQRGRSLGMHLVLATQRPHGAINDRIRTNTNLRIALGRSTAPTRSTSSTTRAPPTSAAAVPGAPSPGWATTS